MEGQTPDRVEVAPQGELWVPGLPQSVAVSGDLRETRRGRGVSFTIHVMMLLYSTTLQPDESLKPSEEIRTAVNNQRI